MSLKISAELETKASHFPESSYGATTVTLVLSSGRRVHDVVLAWASEIVKVGGRHVSDAGDLDFSVSEIVDVVQPGAWKARLSLWREALRHAWGTSRGK